MNEQEYLEHFGVLGMKWGKRKAQSQSSTQTTAKKTKTEKKDAKALKAADKKWAKSKSEKELYKSINKITETEQYKSDQAKAAKTVSKILVPKDRDSAYQSLMAESINKALAKDPSMTSPSGSYSAKLQLVDYMGSTYVRPVVVINNVTHSGLTESTDENLVFHLEYDGTITSKSLPSDAKIVEHSGDIYDYFAHIGFTGMSWETSTAGKIFIDIRKDDII